MDELIKEGRVVQNKPGNVPAYKRYLDEMPGVILQDIWTDIGYLTSASKERKGIGWPTQKPVALYERIISASSNLGDVVLDPFCGSGTTLVAAENLGRRWVGIDLDVEARPVVERRLPQVRLNSSPPVRTDDQRTSLDEPEWGNFGPMPDPRTIIPNNRERRKILADTYGTFCVGCGFSPPTNWRADDRLDYLEVDHVHPRTGKSEKDDRFGNLMLLCGPCNGRKSDKLTYDELIAQNIRDERMKMPEAMVRTIHEYRQRQLNKLNWKY